MALEYNVPSITFEGPVPVNGNASLLIQDDGFFEFKGHFHDSGIPPYNAVFIMTLTASSGEVLSWTKTVSVAGTLANAVDGTGRDGDWSMNGTNGKIAELWGNLQQAPVIWKAEVTTDALSVLNDVFKIVKTLVPVAQFLIPIL